MKEKWPILILTFQGLGFSLMGLYFWYDFNKSFHNYGPGPFVATIGILEICLSVWFYKDKRF